MKGTNILIWAAILILVVISDMICGTTSGFISRISEFQHVWMMLVTISMTTWLAFP